MIRNADGKYYVTPWAVFCKAHGTVALSAQQYNEQMNHPNSLWYCPRCGEQAEWDDDCPETNPVEETEP